MKLPSIDTLPVLDVRCLMVDVKFLQNPPPPSDAYNTTVIQIRKISSFLSVAVEMVVKRLINLNVTRCIPEGVTFKFCFPWGRGEVVLGDDEKFLFREKKSV